MSYSFTADREKINSSNQPILVNDLSIGTLGAGHTGRDLGLLDITVGGVRISGSSSNVVSKEPQTPAEFLEKCGKKDPNELDSTQFSKYLNLLGGNYTEKESLVKNRLKQNGVPDKLIEDFIDHHTQLLASAVLNPINYVLQSTINVCLKDSCINERLDYHEVGGKTWCEAIYTPPIKIPYTLGGSDYYNFFATVELHYELEEKDNTKYWRFQRLKTDSKILDDILVRGSLPKGVNNSQDLIQRMEFEEKVKKWIQEDVTNHENSFLVKKNLSVKNFLGFCIDHLAKPNEVVEVCEKYKITVEALAHLFNIGIPGLRDFQQIDIFIKNFGISMVNFFYHNKEISFGKVKELCNSLGLNVKTFFKTLADSELKQLNELCERYKINKESLFKLFDKNKNLTLKTLYDFCREFRINLKKFVEISIKNGTDVAGFISTVKEKGLSADDLMFYEELTKDVKKDLLGNPNRSIAFVQAIDRLFSAFSPDFEKISEHFTLFFLCFYAFQGPFLSDKDLQKVSGDVCTELEQIKGRLGLLKKNENSQEKNEQLIEIENDLINQQHALEIYKACSDKVDFQTEPANQTKSGNQSKSGEYEDKQLVDLGLIQTIIRKHVGNQSTLFLKNIEEIEKEFTTLDISEQPVAKKLIPKLAQNIEALAIHAENLKISASPCPKEIGKTLKAFFAISHHMTKAAFPAQLTTDISMLKARVNQLISNSLNYLHANEQVKCKVMKFLHDSLQENQLNIRKARREIKSINQKVIALKNQINPRSTWIDKLKSFFSRLLGIGTKKLVNKEELKQQLEKAERAYQDRKNELCMKYKDFYRVQSILKEIQSKTSLKWAFSGEGLLKRVKANTNLLSGCFGFFSKNERKTSYEYICCPEPNPHAFKVDSFNVM